MEGFKGSGFIGQRSLAAGSWLFVNARKFLASSQQREASGEGQKPEIFQKKPKCRIFQLANGKR
jgi:hypothetical protein